MPRSAERLRQMKSAAPFVDRMTTQRSISFTTRGFFAGLINLFRSRLAGRKGAAAAVLQVESRRD
jgi:hypothetical protein